MLGRTLTECSLPIERRAGPAPTLLVVPTQGISARRTKRAWLVLCLTCTRWTVLRNGSDLTLLMALLTLIRVMLQLVAVLLTCVPTLLAMRGTIRIALLRQLLWCLPWTIDLQTRLAAIVPCCDRCTFMKCLQRLRLRLALVLLLSMQILLRRHGSTAFGLMPTHGLSPTTAIWRFCVLRTVLSDVVVTFPLSEDMMLLAMKTRGATGIFV